jgi:tetratricopeptide (TPR) repeat protein
MKRISLMLATAVAILSSCNNHSPEQGGKTENAQYQKLYENSMKLKDVHTGIYAIQMILLTDSTNNLRDSLPEMYGAINNINACMETNEASLKRHPNEEKYKNIKVLCLQQLGDVNGQFVLLEDLYQTTKKPQYIANIVSLQLNAGQVKEANKTIEFIINEYRNNKTDSLDIFLDEVNKERVPVLAAAYNMKGYVYMQQRNIPAAKEAYYKAMEIYPDFQMPQRNLEMIITGRYRQ